MRVLIDMTYVTAISDLQKSIPIWLLRILDNIPSQNRKDFSLLIFPQMEEYFRNKYSGFTLIEFIPKGAIFPSPSFLQYILCAKRLKKILSIKRFDCLFLQGGVAKYFYFKHNEKVIVVEHDMKILKDRMPGILGAYNRQMARHTAFKYWGYVDKVLAISQFTKEDILSLCPSLSPEKIEVVYNSVVLPSQSQKSNNLPEGGYLLYVNTLQEYKNVATLIKAYNLIKDRTDLPLVLVGKSTDYWENVMLPYIFENRFENRIIRLEGLSNEELRYLYEHATLFITPSTHEGFGYTPIEAAMCECPVISSKCEALPESTRGLLNYYEPATDERVLGEVILNTIANLPLKESLRRISDEYRTVYSPENQLKGIMELINKTCATN